MQLAIIGSGATSIYLLKHIAEANSKTIKEIHIFEKGILMGMGLPYNPYTTDIYHLANISSEEIPAFKIPFAEWLQNQNTTTLQELNIEKSEIDKKTVYSRLALGRYLHGQYLDLIADLEAQNIKIYQHPQTEVLDIEDNAEDNTVKLITSTGLDKTVDRVIISTGHGVEAKDEPGAGYYKSPWPIQKILPADSEMFNFPIGILGSSLSAFDVVTSLAHRHGTFSKVGESLLFNLDGDAPDFKIVLHSAEGWLPHLQYEQKRPMRDIYRYASLKELMQLRDENGFLRLETYFQKVCKPVLHAAFVKNSLNKVADKLNNTTFSFEDFIDAMSEKHEYNDPFEGMKKELVEAEKSVNQDIPIYWKEAIDDLMYSLNFHMEFLSAEDHSFYHKKVMPFLMNIIAAMPLPSAEILLALSDAHVLSLQKGMVEEIDPFPNHTRLKVVEGDKTINTSYNLFIACGGDEKLELKDYPFRSLMKEGAVRSARAAFANVPNLKTEEREDSFEENGKIYATLPGIDVNAGYRIINVEGNPNPRIYDPTFTHLQGLRPYSYGLQACAATANMVVVELLSQDLSN